ncbi:MAG TPA: hypoxanthine phosphoribosyltransferase [Pirellulales bacterium]|jgi:hypoxanthine phosphoribosyltransferase|nr:hypoxanthine phosphoribosyltransferase [Pirellulales bacterium]
MVTPAMAEMKGACLRLLLSEGEIRSGVERMAGQIAAHYEGRSLTIIGVLTGSVVLLADLIRLLKVPLRVGVVQARSYRGAATTPGALSINADLLPDIRGRDVLLIDDIFDTGRTLLELVSQIDELAPRSLRSAVLLRKLGRCQVPIAPDFVGFEIPNEFVVGYGLDYRDAYRNLPYVAALDAAELSEAAAP